MSIDITYTVDNIEITKTGRKVEFSGPYESVKFDESSIPSLIDVLKRIQIDQLTEDGFSVGCF